ncbi:MAG: nuclear transport factor 2 family protein [Pseudomonadota bacterium]
MSILAADQIDFQSVKAFVRGHMAAFDMANATDSAAILKRDTAANYQWRGMHPFYEQQGAAAVSQLFWAPLKRSLKAFQRREDIFFAGQNSEARESEVWTCSMGHFMGLFDETWLSIPATRKITFLPYAEFHRVEGEKIAETALFVDIVRLMQQAGMDPLPHQSAAAITQPGPRTHDGLVLDQVDPAQTQRTHDLLEAMVADLNHLNRINEDRCPPEFLGKTWHDDMVWYGPAGIGTTYTIKRYQEQHQYPFRERLSNKVFNGHVSRFAEGHYAGWFGWPNLNNTNTGGFLGLEPSDVNAQMRVVDIYRRQGDKLAENWVFIDILYYLFQHGIDLLKTPQALAKK